MLDFPPPPPRRVRTRGAWIPWIVLPVAPLTGLVLLFVMGARQWYDAPDLTRMEQEARIRGQMVGDTSNENACVAAAQAYALHAGGIYRLLETDRFTQGCLHAARPTARFCDEVPRLYTPRSLPWRNSRCRAIPFSGEYTNCSRVMENVQAFCAEPDSVRHAPPDTVALDSAEAADTASAAEPRTGSASRATH